MRLVLAGLIVLLAGVSVWLRPVPEWRFALLDGAALGTGASFETEFEYSSPEGTAHAPAFIGAGEDFGVMWFDGIRESHNDVRILSKRDDDINELLTRQQLSSDMVPPQTILTLGNPLSHVGQGLYVTAVSLGGWAASSVVRLDVRGLHRIWIVARKLSLSPVLNRSHLVKSPIVDATNGAHILPSYFEMGAAYGAAVYVDAAGRVRGQSVMTGGKAAIQPMVVALSETHAVSLLRSFDRDVPFLMFSETRDGGRSWSAPEALDLPNPSAPVAAVRLEDGRILMLFNDDAENAETLTFAVSEDGRNWTRTRVLDGPGKGDLRYPMMAVLADGRIAVTYSFGTKAGIVAHVLSADWALGK